MLLKTYKFVGGAICLWFGIAAFAGWKAPSLGGSGAASGKSGSGWIIFSGGGRSSSGSGGWGGGK